MEDLLVMRIISFLIDHGVDIMMVPKDLKIAVDEKLCHMSKTQVATYTVFYIMFGTIKHLYSAYNLQSMQYISFIYMVVSP